jgi:hypothetical protein
VSSAAVGEITNGGSPAWRCGQLRSASIPLRHLVVSKVGLFDGWPLNLMDLYTYESIVGHS